MYFNRWKQVGPGKSLGTTMFVHRLHLARNRIAFLRFAFADISLHMICSGLRPAARDIPDRS